MAYVTISHWELATDTDEAAVKEYAEKNMSVLKGMGAERGYMVMTDDATGVIIMVYPDEATWQKASETVAKMRSEGASELNSKLTGAAAGTATVEV